MRFHHPVNCPICKKDNEWNMQNVQRGQPAAMHRFAFQLKIWKEEQGTVPRGI